MLVLAVAEKNIKTATEWEWCNVGDANKKHLTKNEKF